MACMCPMTMPREVKHMLSHPSRTKSIGRRSPTSEHFEDCRIRIGPHQRSWPSLESANCPSSTLRTSSYKVYEAWATKGADGKAQGVQRLRRLADVARVRPMTLTQAVPAPATSAGGAWSGAAHLAAGGPPVPLTVADRSHPRHPGGVPPRSAQSVERGGRRSRQGPPPAPSPRDACSRAARAKPHQMPYISGSPADPRKVVG